jgi:hypothetical protein
VGPFPTRSLLVAGVLAGLVAAPPTASAVLPAAAVARGSGTAVIARDGSTVHRFGSFGSYSLAGTLFAGSGGARGDAVVAADAVTGRVRFRIKNAFAPVVLASRRVAFLPDHAGRRDPQGNSVWLRTPRGTIRRIVQFANGPGLPGIQTGQPDAGAILALSFDAAGRTLAVAEGNDVDLFFYDIWIVDVGTGAAFRATTGNRSRFPSLSPDGRSLAFLREEAQCGGPAPGYRAGDVKAVATVRGAAARILLDGSCAVFYTEPRWLSGGELVAVRLTRTGPGEYRNDLVLADASTGAVTVLDAGGDVFGLSVAPGLRLVGYMRFDAGSVLFDVDARTATAVPDGFAPKLAGDRAW